MQLTIPFYPDTLQLPCLKLFQSENCIYHNYSLCTSDRMPASSCLKVSGHTPMVYIENCSYCYWLHTLEAQYITIRIFTWYGVNFATSYTTLTTKKEVSLLQFQMSTPPPLLGQCHCRCMHVYSFKPLYRDAQLVHINFTFCAPTMQGRS